MGNKTFINGMKVNYSGVGIVNDYFSDIRGNLTACVFYISKINVPDDFEKRAALKRIANFIEKYRNEVETEKQWFNSKIQALINADESNESIVEYYTKYYLKNASNIDSKTLGVGEVVVISCDSAKDGVYRSTGSMNSGADFLISFFNSEYAVNTTIDTIREKKAYDTENIKTIAQEYGIDYLTAKEIYNGGSGVASFATGLIPVLGTFQGIGDLYEYAVQGNLAAECSTGATMIAAAHATDFAMPKIKQGISKKIGKDAIIKLITKIIL